MLNSISAILASLNSIEEQTVQFDMKEDIEQLKSAILTLQSQVTYTQVYQDIGAFDPRWQDFQKVIPSLVIPDSVTFTWDKENVLVFADPMVDKVFMILLENSLTHGKNVSAISLGIRKTESGLLFTWEDNGVGVAEGEKEQIFEKGFGKNTGLGLFLAREILALTGISIRETGIEGKGAKFDILVPSEFYRIKPGNWGTAIWSDQQEV
jgi:signal transduction histidine kinase